MITVRGVISKKDVKTFINFPIGLYKGCKYFVPPFYSDEKILFTKKNPYLKTCEFAFFLAEDNGKTVGRIGVILQKVSNQIRSERRVRFTRFDAIDSQEVADALFKAVENWALAKGMDTVCGPLGFSDLEREGLLIEGFEELSTFEEQYNYPYYQKLIENCGYAKEVDWEERKLYRTDNPDPRMETLTQRLFDKYRLHYSDCKNMSEFIRRYADGLFDLLDESYKDIYQTVPFTREMKDSIISTFKLAVDLKHTNVIVDENDNIVCFGVSFPSMAEAVQKSNGHLTPAAIVRLIKAIKHPKVYDLGLIGVSEKYQNTGIAGALILEIYKILRDENIDHLETNLNLENNEQILNCWKRFNNVLHKRRRAFVKSIGNPEIAVLKSSPNGGKL